MPDMSSHTPGEVSGGYQSEGAALIAAERRRQIEDEGWTAAADDLYFDGQLCSAARCYLHAGDRIANGQSSAELVLREFKELADAGMLDWPFDLSWLKVSEDPIRNLVKAGALIAAEIDRLKREKAKAKP